MLFVIAGTSAATLYASSARWRFAEQDRGVVRSAARSWSARAAAAPAPDGRGGAAWLVAELMSRYSVLASKLPA